MLHALRNTAVSVLYQDMDLRLVWARNGPKCWAEGLQPGLEDADYLPAPVAERVTAVKRRVLATAIPDKLEISVPGPAGVQWFDIWIDGDVGEDGELRGIVTTAVETTEHKRREQTLRALIREVSHRSRNLLAIIQSIATQTGRFSGNIDVFLTRFRGRLQSLASSQDLVTSSNWRGANLGELLAGQVARYGLPSGAVGFDGANPWLNPNAALHIGLALHELAVNSISYGALSQPGGSVDVSARLLDHSPDKTSLCLRWTEAIGGPDDPLADAPVRERRFGSIALEQIVPASLNGAATLEIAGGKLVYTLTIPFGSFEVD